MNHVLKERFGLDHLRLHVPRCVDRETIHEIHESLPVTIDRESIHHVGMADQSAPIGDAVDHSRHSIRRHESRHDGHRSGMLRSLATLGAIDDVVDVHAAFLVPEDLEGFAHGRVSLARPPGTSLVPQP